MNLRMRRARRGQAAVEMAVSMLVILPLVFYTLFLEDLTYYNLEWQEAIVVSPWDALPLDYTATSPDPAGNPMRYNRKVYCDHTAAYDSFNKNYDCTKTVHHQAMTAHQCWLLAQDGQITCSLNKATGALVEPGYAALFGKGGMVSCSARLGVLNYFIPNQLFYSSETGGTGKALGQTSSGEVKQMTNKEFIKGKGDGTGSSAGTAHQSKDKSYASVWVFGYEGGPAAPPPAGGDDEEGGDGTAGDDTGVGPTSATGSGPADDWFGVVHDSWAVNDVGTVYPEMGQAALTNKFYQRMDYYYQLKAKTGADQAKSFADSLKGDSLLGDEALQEPTGGDDPAVPQMAYAKDDNERVGPSSFFPQFYSAGYSDSRQPATYTGRQDQYFGMQVSDW